MLLAKNWWAFLLRGILALIFGIAAVFFPESAFLTLVLLFGAFAFVDGVFAIISAFSSNAKSENWWWIIIEGILGITVGALTVFQPASMATALLFIIAAWAIVGGVFEIVTAIRIRKHITGEFWMALSGLISIVFGFLVAANPLSGAFAIGLIIGVYAIIFGIMFILFSFKLRGAATPVIRLSDEI